MGKKEINLRLETIVRVEEVFESKNWDIDDANQSGKFNMFCKMLHSLPNREEQDLVIELLEDFLHIDGDKYSPEIVNILKDFLATYPNLKNLFVLPLLSEKDKDKVKSSHTVLYKFKGTTIKYNVPALGKVKPSVLNTVNELNNVSDNQMVMLVDDFIGTGETALEAIAYLRTKKPNIDIDKIAILTIVIQKSALDNLSELGFKVFYSILRNKGISEKYNVEDVERKLLIMSNVENRLNKLKEEYRLGYKQSESLVCMERTPNNTFPIFWYQNKKLQYYPPFPR